MQKTAKKKSLDGPRFDPITSSDDQIQFKEIEMRRSIIAASLVLTTSMPVLAQNLDTLRDGLNALPASLLMQNRGDLAYFVDVQAIHTLGANNPDLRPYFRLMLGTEINALDSLSRTDPAEWQERAGIALDQLRFMMGYGVPPNVVNLWGLANEAATAEMMTALEARGFETAGATGVIGNGEPMRMDPQRRDPSDPWRTRIGAAQFAAAKGNSVVQAQTPQEALLVSSSQPALGDNPIFATALAGLEQSVGDHWILQAAVISPAFGLGGIDPALVLSPSGDMDETRQKIEEQMAALGKGIPPYLGGIIADVQGESTGISIALAYTDCEMAQLAADLIGTRWSEMAGEAAQGEMADKTVESQNGLCAATLSVFIESDNLELNPAYRSVLDAYFGRQPGILQIGES
jgi:hypothetical protein